ncbi:MAG: hypothetical protein IKZ88_05160 [Neisseriaceae bacterium]|nr:hypothetical protein [Neisseriaceae bacterium]MBR5940629.1 hypothetical protein [Neisseriaceae bacterium]
MYKKLLITTFLTIALTGCLSTQPRTIIIQANPNAISEKLQLPQQISFNNEIYTKKHTNIISAEYYLENEKDYDWTKLITISYAPINNLDAYLQSAEQVHKQGNAQNNKSEYKINKINDKQAFIQELYYPNSNNPNFNKFEANFKLHQLKNCGIVIAQYAENFDKNTSPQVIQKQFFQQKEKLFLQNYPQIECK